MRLWGNWCLAGSFIQNRFVASFMDRFAGGSGYNQENCKLKACISVEEMLKRGKALAEKTDASTRDPHRKDCPVDKDKLGRSTWNLLHTMSVAYPDKPSPQDAKVMNDFLQNLSKTYPCSYCAADLRKDLQLNPPDLRDKKSFAQWMCEMHNRVNDKLGKDLFDCSRVFERWVDGWKDGSCDY
ncbi:hypothetical protein QR680_017333 [Steinernema hermaphroditum]|uniref:Sulfhydryl oxidase n=1 Tax=Steinernema hermaphroditum TaxID=289476 RepID=A0AA39LNY2_9BILA|nr:hypothetical protein QR680_017333 [Steinernema hermaphroditum]